LIDPARLLTTTAFSHPGVLLIAVVFAVTLPFPANPDGS
jgi:hypothetical protein